MIRFDIHSDTLPKIVLRNGAEMPGAIAMRRKSLGIWQTITWKEVSDQVRRIAAGLLTTEPTDDPCIAIIGDNEPELFWAEYAIQATGRAAVCLYPDSTPADCLDVFSDCKCRIVFVENQEQCDKMLEIADRADLRAIIYWDGRGMSGYADSRVFSLETLRQRGDEYLGKNAATLERTIRQANCDDLAVVIYTSGTSGGAKGVMGSHRYLLDIAERWRVTLDADPGIDYVSYISPAWGVEQYVGLTLSASLPMIVNFPEEPETVTTDLREIGAEFLFFGSRQWEAILSSTESRMRDAGRLVQWIYRWGMRALSEGQSENATAYMKLKRAFADIVIGRPMRDRLGFTYLRTAVNSGSVLSPEVFGLFHALGVSLRNVYGFTEIGIVTATRDQRRFDTVGKILKSPYGGSPLEIRISDNEIQVRGGVVFDGYYGKPEITAARYTSDGWVRSGDAGYFDEDGNLVYLDRLDDLRQLSNGHTIAPQFIETRIRLSPYVQDVIAIGDETRDFVGALVDIDMEMVGRWAEERKIPFTGLADLSQRDEVYRLIESELVRVNAGLPEQSRVARFVNLFKSFDADEGELTRSRKLRRSVVESKYRDLVAGLDGHARSVECSIEIKYRDGRTRMMTAEAKIWDVGTADPRPMTPAVPQRSVA